MDVVRGAVETHPDGICITNTELTWPGPRIVYVNEAFTTITGHSRDAVIGETPRLLQGPLTNREVLRRMRSALAAGEPFDGATINYRRDGSAFVMRWTIDPAAGDTSHYIAFQRDVTADTQLRLQRTALRHLSSAAVDLMDHRDLGLPAGLDLIREAVDMFALAGEVVCFAGTDAQRVTAPRDAEIRLDHHRYTIHRSRPQVLDTSDGATVIFAPFGSTSGGIEISGLDHASVGLIDLDLLDDLARAADALLRAVADLDLRRREALAVQRVLLPPSELVVPGHDVASRYVPSTRSVHAGGDWYDAVTTEWGVRLCVGDVVGKGMLAAAGMGVVRSHLRAQLAAGAPLAAVMAEADAFCRDEGVGASALVVDLWRESGQLAIASCGHPPPIVVDAEGARILQVEPAPPLGAFQTPGPAPVPTHARLAEDEVLVLYTDAAIDDRITGGDGIHHLASHLAGTPPDVEACAAAVVELTVGMRTDDLAVLAVTASR